MKPGFLLFATLLLLPLAPLSAGSPPDIQHERCVKVMDAQLAKPYPPDGLWHTTDFALAAYWLDKRTKEADTAILASREKEFPESLKKGDFHWNACLFERICFLFGKSSRYFPGRMDPVAEEAVMDMLWQWAAPRCRLEMTLPERDWWQWGSENHHAQAWSSFWGAAHLFAQNDTYKNRRYDDGSTPAEMAAAFDGYFKRFARERASKGLLVECNSGYNKYTLGGWYNIADFSEDPVLRNRMAMLLDLYWADWAVEQIGGVRGGSRHRCYPGTDSTAGTSMDGVSWFHFGLGTPESHHPSAMCAATTFWRPSRIVSDLASDVAGRGEYEYLSRRPGLAEVPKMPGAPVNYMTDKNNPFFSERGVTCLMPQGGGLLRYSWCTPDFILGTSMVGARPKEDWAATSSQNRWEGVIFAGHPTARIFVQSPTPAHGSVYNANWSVQKRGTLIVQRLKDSNAKGQRIWFDASLHRVEHDGWIFTEAPEAFAAVRVINGTTAWEPDSTGQHHEKKGATDTGEWLKCTEEFSPVIIDVVRKSACPDFAEFQRATLANPLRWENNRLDYTSRANNTTLSLFADYSQPPLIDGRPVDYSPGRVYDSPFITSDFGSGLVTIQKDGEKLLLDFNK